MFNLPDGDFKYSKKNKGGSTYLLKFPSPVKTFDKKNDTVHCILKESSGTRKACILVHGLGMSPSSKFDDSLNYIPENISGCFIDLPYHRRRKTDIDLISSFYDGIFSLNFFRQGVLDIIRTVDVLENMDYREIYITGISLGSFFSLISMALDSRIKKGVFILCGGDQGVITWESPAMYKVRKRHRKDGISREDCLKCRSFFDDFFQTVKKGHRPDRIKSDVICFYFDTLSFAPLINTENVLMINALFDVVIPRKSTLKLHKALGEPLIRWLPAGHLSLSLFKKKIASYTRSFLLYK